MCTCKTIREDTRKIRGRCERERKESVARSAIVSDQINEQVTCRTTVERAGRSPNRRRPHYIITLLAFGLAGRRSCTKATACVRVAGDLLLLFIAHAVKAGAEQTGTICSANRSLRRRSPTQAVDTTEMKRAEHAEVLARRPRSAR